MPQFQFPLSAENNQGNETGLKCSGCLACPSLLLLDQQADQQYVADQSKACGCTNIELTSQLKWPLGRGTDCCCYYLKSLHYKSV